MCFYPSVQRPLKALVTIEDRLSEKYTERLGKDSCAMIRFPKRKAEKQKRKEKKRREDQMLRKLLTRPNALRVSPVSRVVL
jgi:hypothetical protein